MAMASSSLMILVSYWFSSVFSEKVLVVVESAGVKRQRFFNRVVKLSQDSQGRKVVEISADKQYLEIIGRILCSNEKQRQLLHHW